MRKILKQLKPFKIPLILIGAFALLYLITAVILPTFQRLQAYKTPIVSIEGSNEEEYSQGMEIRKGDFHIVATHEDGKQAALYADEFNISTTVPTKTGDTTEVVVVLESNPSISTVIQVKNERHKVAEVSCGSPELDAVKAVLYSNGELSFEGSGDVLQYDRNTFPWQNMGEQRITSVTFEPGVLPTSMDYWFQSMTDLTTIGSLPKSVESIVGMCYGCSSLTDAPEWKQCNNLLDTSNAFEDCVLLKNIPAIPSSVRSASYMCRGCVELQNTPDMTQATSLVNATGMYENCKKLTTTTDAPSIEIMDYMYAYCINLKNMPNISKNTKSMSRTFENNVSLVTVTKIPKQVRDVSGCFNSCTKISGTLKVDANPENYVGFLANTCNATELNLTGKSSMLNELALTHTNYNVTINGAVPVES